MELALFDIIVLTAGICCLTIWLAIKLRQTRKELNDLKSRMAKPGDVSRLIEQCERDLVKREYPPRQPKTFPPGRVLREGQQPPKYAPLITNDNHGNQRTN